MPPGGAGHGLDLPGGAAAGARGPDQGRRLGQAAQPGQEDASAGPGKEELRTGHNASMILGS